MKIRAWKQAVYLKYIQTFHSVSTVDKNEHIADCANGPSSKYVHGVVSAHLKSRKHLRVVRDAI